MLDRHDPRTDGSNVRRLSHGDAAGDVLLVGVVHDHPASAHRVRSLAAAADPDVLALELPPLAVPLFEQYAGEGGVPTSGDEMSAGIQVADSATVVGIDGPSLGFLRRLAQRLARREASLSTVRAVLESLLSVSTHAVACRVAALLGAPEAARPAVDGHVEHDVTAADDPERQAADEQTQIRRARAVLGAFGKTDAVAVRDETREAHMAARITSLRERGDVLAVVGADHLGPLATRLS